MSLPLTKSTQAYEEVSGDQPPYDPVGRSIVHQSAYQQATGEAKYLDDIPLIAGKLYAAPILNSRSLAKIVRVYVEETLSLTGVNCFVTHKDVPKRGSNMNGVFDDERLFAESKVEIISL